jgi:hypothetical protein
MSNKVEHSQLRKVFADQKNKLKYKNKYDKLGNLVEWKLTFEEWLKIWQDSGHIDEMGRNNDSYCMRRKNDIGHYEMNNVYIGKFGGNSSEQKGRPKLTLRGRPAHNRGEWEDLKYSQKYKLYLAKDSRVPLDWKPIIVRGTEESKARLSAAQLGRKQSEDTIKKKSRAVIIDGTEYISIHEAARQLNLLEGTLRNRLNKGWAGYSYK